MAAGSNDTNIYVYINEGEEDDQFILNQTIPQNASVLSVFLSNDLRFLSVGK